MADRVEGIRTSFATEAVLAGLLVHQHPRWPPRLALATDPARPWFPVVFGMYGSGTSTTRLTGSARRIAADKVQAARLLHAAGVPVPEGRMFEQDTSAAVLRYARSLGDVAVIKPVSGNAKRGVSLGVRSAAQVDAALAKLRADGFADQPFLVQRQVVGSELRITATRSKVLSAIYRRPVTVTGDGVSSLRRLLEVRAERLGSSVGAPGDSAVPPDAELDAVLSGTAWTADQVLPDGRELTLTGLIRRRYGGGRVEVGPELHPSLRELAVAAVRAVPGVDVGGIDVILQRGHRVAADQQQVTVLELNAGAAVRNCLAPTQGEPVNIYRLILEDLAAEAGVAIGETATTMRMLVRCGYPVPGSGTPPIDRIRRVAMEVEALPGEHAVDLMVKARSDALHAVLDVLRSWADSLTILAVPSGACGDVVGLRELLYPPVLVPQDHQHILADAFAHRGT